MRLETERYTVQEQQWPQHGRVILAHHDDSTVTVYQAYKESIGRYAAQHGHFGGDFSFTRMSWIKPNFLWMMFRSGWGTKANQEVTLAITLKRETFDHLLAQAVHSSFVPDVYESETTWQEAVQRSNVRLQWDPDHGPTGTCCTRRAIQLGVRGDVLDKYAKEWIVRIEDISDFVAEQRQHVQAGELSTLVLPRETVYSIADAAVAARLQVSERVPVWTTGGV